ncbi:MAG: hypothetical protein Fur0021_01880 [Candidatus Promineifilaceae bacterium]
MAAANHKSKYRQTEILLIYYSLLAGMLPDLQPPEVFLPPFATGDSCFRCQTCVTFLDNIILDLFDQTSPEITKRPVKNNLTL